jgi:uncharacterized Ntn-hydrolase superfamily protein
VRRGARMQQEGGKSGRFFGGHGVALWGALSLAVLLVASRASATYSIAAVDVKGRTIGAAGTSCLDGGDVAVIYSTVPRVGVVIAQAEYDLGLQQRATQLLTSGMAPKDVIADVTSPGVDPRASVRQYALVDATGRTAAFTGSDTGEWSGDTQGGMSSRMFSVQGNILTSENVIANAAASFQQSPCALAEQLMLALEAGARNHEGDRRCTPAIPSDSAFLFVESLDTGSRLVNLRVPASGAANPVTELRAQFTSSLAAGCVEQTLEIDRTDSVGGDDPGCHLVRGPSRARPPLFVVLGLAALAARGRRSATLRRPWRSTT